MVGSETKSLYRRHFDGAVSLLQHRGLRVFDDHLSTGLFRAVRAHMVSGRVLSAALTID